jgi:hypothetical protein
LIIGALLSCGLALAGEPTQTVPEPVSAARPLAIPRDPAPRPPPSVPVIDAEKLEAIRSYRSRHLAIRHYSSLSVGTAITPGYGYGFGYGYGSMRTSYPYYYPVNGWGVFQGPVRLQTPAYLNLVQDEPTSVLLQRRVRTNRGAGYALYAAGLAGVVGTLVAGTQASNAQTLAELKQWRTVGTVSTLALLGGFIGGSFPMSKARRLLTQPGLSVDLQEIERQVSTFNEDLREDLELTPAEVLAIENAPPN